MVKLGDVVCAFGPRLLILNNKVVDRRCVVRLVSEGVCGRLVRAFEDIGVMGARLNGGTTLLNTTCGTTGVGWTFRATGDLKGSRTFLVLGFFRFDGDVGSQFFQFFLWLGRRNSTILRP